MFDQEGAVGIPRAWGKTGRGDASSKQWTGKGGIYKYASMRVYVHTSLCMHAHRMPAWVDISEYMYKYLDDELLYISLQWLPIIEANRTAASPPLPNNISIWLNRTFAE